MRIIGLTGGIGTGKSTVARFLAGLGAKVIDVDRVGHRALRPGSKVSKSLIASFGREILNQSGEVDRAKLGKLVFKNHEVRKRLNAIIHPEMQEMVRKTLDKYRQQGIRDVVLDVPLLLDAGWDKLVDEVWVTAAPEEVVLRRTRKRSGLSATEIKSRIRTQMPQKEKIRRADAVIDTDSPPEELKARVTELWKQRHRSS
ncbi:dephospho-CoA kinase [Chloroflexota bacterium]